MVRGEGGSNSELMDAAALVGHLVSAGSVFALLAEHRRELFALEMFADLFPARTGRPSLPAEVAASVLELQALGDLSDLKRSRHCGVICGGRWPAGWRWMTRGFIRAH